MSIEPDTILQFVNSLGLLALIALGCGAMARAALPPNAEAGGHIALFGGGAILAMLAGAGIEPGVRVDGSGIVIGLAGLFLAPVVAMAAAALAGVFRLFVLGGFGATADAVGIVLACGLGLAAAQALKARRTFDVRELLLAGLFIRLSLVSLFVLPFGIAVAALPQALLTLPFSAAAALVFGLLLQRERRLTGQARGLLLGTARDPLTDLETRRGLRSAFAREAARPGRRTGALVLLDIDHFGHVRDLFGDEAADMVLRKVGDLLRTNLRAGDSASRVGPEQFALFLPAIEAEQAARIAERLRNALADATFIHDGQAFQITASLGVTATQGVPTFTPAYRAADGALCCAKAAGRNCVMRAWDPDITAVATADLLHQGARPA